MSIYSDKLAHVQVFINCRYSNAQMCTCEDTLAHYLGAPFIYVIMRHNTHITEYYVYTKSSQGKISYFLIKTKIVFSFFQGICDSEHLTN